MSDRVRLEVGGDAVGVVSLARADKLNALDRATFEELHSTASSVGEAIAAGDVRAVLIRGDGRAFCAGLDVSLFGEQLASGGIDDAHIAWLQEAFTGFEDLPVPVVAAIQGVCIGAGLQLALAAHLRLAGEDASMGLLEGRWGLVPDLGGTYRLPRVVGLSRAIDLAVTARTIDAQTAGFWGLVDAVHPVEELDAAARAHAAALAAGPTVATGQVPELMRSSLGRDRDNQLAAERTAQSRCLASDDFREAATAAMEGRSPGFTGR